MNANYSTHGSYISRLVFCSRDIDVFLSSCIRWEETPIAVNASACLMRPAGTEKSWIVLTVPGTLACTDRIYTHVVMICFGTCISFQYSDPPKKVFGSDASSYDIVNYTIVLNRDQTYSSVGLLHRSNWSISMNPTRCNITNSTARGAKMRSKIIHPR